MPVVNTAFSATFEWWRGRAWGCLGQSLLFTSSATQQPGVGDMWGASARDYKAKWCSSVESKQEVEFCTEDSPGCYPSPPLTPTQTANVPPVGAFPPTCALVFQVVVLAMYNLSLEGSGRQGYFRWKEDICAFIEKHWTFLLGNR